jgi:fatty-acyl-CoA synthase
MSECRDPAQSRAGCKESDVPNEPDLLWLDDGCPAPGRIARVHLRDLADIQALERRHRPEQLLPALTVFDALMAAAAVAPDKPAIVQVDTPDGSQPARTITYAALRHEMVRAANLFHAASDGAPVRVATVLPMIPQALTTAWAAMASGISLAINPYLERDYVDALLERSRATVLVTSAGAYGSGRWDDVANLRRRVPGLKAVFVIGGDDPATAYDAAIARQPDSLAFAPVDDPDACASYQLTGGTTSMPKLCKLTHRGMLINAWLVGAMQDQSVDGAVGHAMPNFHIGGAVVVALRTILFSQTLVTLTPDGFRNPLVVKHFWDIARRHRLTAVLATPTTAAAILADPDGDPTGHAITAFGCGGSTVPLALNRAFHARFGVWLREQWGFSEAQGNITGHFRDGREPVNGSVGYRFPYYRVAALHLDDDNRFQRMCAPGERGVLAVCGPVSDGYLDAALNPGLFVTGMPAGETWVSSGDLGAVDDNGYVWLFGRTKDVIVRGGHNIDPVQVEEALVGHPAVQVAAAIGRPDPAKGEMPIAYVQLKAGTTVEPDELRRHCARHIQERAAVPVEVIIVEAMPLTAVGKVSKPALRRDALIRCARGVAERHAGPCRTIRIAIDDAGRRPRLRISIEGGDRSRAGHVELAFAGYEFATEITISA